MGQRFPWHSKANRILIFGLLVMTAWLLVFGGSVGDNEDMLVQMPTGHPQLVSVQPFPEMNGEMCPWMPASAQSSLLAALQQVAPASQGEVPDEAARLEASKRKPARVMRDSYSGYSAVAVDPVRNEVVMTDENLFSILVYDRRENTPPQATMSEPKRMIRGDNTDIEFQCSVYVDPATGDIYAVNNDTLGKLVIFSKEARGDVSPDRFINTPHTTFGIAVDDKNQEMFLTIQDDAAVVTYPKAAKGDDPPIRLLQGEQTLLADPHGIALDSKRDLLYVSNWGSVNVHKAPPGGAKTGTIGRGGGHPNWPTGRNYAVPGSGKFMPPSVTVYPRTARGNKAPLRVIQGPKTQLNWPTALSVNPKTGELFVANDTAHSILVFAADANGDVAPIRVLKGPKTLIKNPTGVFYDGENDELWVANFGNHTATVYKPTASGDTPPLRVIRSGPLDTPAPMMGNPHVVAFDSKRDEILVAN